MLERGLPANQTPWQTWHTAQLLFTGKSRFNIPFTYLAPALEKFWHSQYNVRLSLTT
jgi:hypothetical protein